VKGRLATLVAGLVLSGGAAATAASSGDAVPTYRSIIRTYGGITCAWNAIRSDSGVACNRADGTGLVVFVTTHYVGVSTLSTTKALFFRNQPVHSPGFKPFNDKRVFHSETHRRVICYWARLPAPTALCNRADNHGYLTRVSHSVAMVLNEKSRVVFSRNQP
jgi:hypothetical protein